MKISVEKALEILDRYSEQVSLSEVQEMVFRRTWEGCSYQEIAKESGYQLSYIRDIGYRLWQILSTILGQKITKNNVQQILKQKWLVNSKPTELGSNEPLEMLKPLQNLEEKGFLLLEEKASRGKSWGEVIDVSAFFGRQTEVDVLRQWIEEDRCRLITVFGTYGIGKTALAAIATECVEHEFEYLVWRSLRGTQSVTELLTEIILFLSNQQEINLPRSLDGLISRLMRYLSKHRCLLILDSYDSLLQSQERAGRYNSDFEGYAQLLQRIADERHQSCVVITTREKPIGIAALEGERSPVRSLLIQGLSPDAAPEILKAKNLVFTEDECREFNEYYAGNPLLLKLAATSIQSLFAGSVSSFLAQGTFVFGDIWDIIEQQFNRLSAVEKLVMQWLFTNQGQLLVWQCLESSCCQFSRRELLEALQSLQQRSLVELNSSYFTQPAVIKEYMTEIEKYQQPNLTKRLQAS